MRSAPRRARRAAASGLYELKSAVARYPGLALPVERLRGRGVVVTDATDIVIEGYPRSASTFAVAAFRLAQEPEWVEVAHHTHMPAQVIEAVRREIPALVLIRSPGDAVVSLLIHSPDRSVRSALHGYLRFYEPLVPLRRRVVVATFHQVVTDLGSVIARLNTRFDTAFRHFVHTPQNIARIEREIEDDSARRWSDAQLRERKIPRPSEARESMKEQVTRVYANAPEHLQRRAEHVFDTFVGET